MLHNPATFLRVDLNALQYNYRFFKSKLQEQTKILAVIKAFAYGHEAIAIAKKLEKEELAYFAVAYVQEGIHLRNAGIMAPIVVLHPQQSDLKDCITYNLEPNLYSIKILQDLLTLLHNTDISNYPIHLKFNSGLNRLGFSEKEIPQILEKIKQSKKVKIVSVFSHLVASEDLVEKTFTDQQIKTYKRIVKTVESDISYPLIKHLCNTSGTLNYPEAHFDMVRIGIGLYGYANEEKWTAELINVGSLYSVISQIHTVKKGESVGYNRAYIADKRTISATIPIGHADGIPRTWGKGVGYVSINGKKAAILGNVCMDMIMVDVTEIACKEGDRVVIFDSQQTLEDLALRTKTISYEVLTAISQRVPRVIID